MIFVCTGTQIFQFNRLLMELDRLVDRGLLKEDIFAQTGKSDYRPSHYKYKPFLDPQEYESMVKESDLIITHGGTGAIVKALKSNKQVIAVPRQKSFHEHEDDHQFQIVDFFESNGYILKVSDISKLHSQIDQIRKKPINKQFSGDGHIIEIIEAYIQNDC